MKDLPLCEGIRLVGAALLMVGVIVGILLFGAGLIAVGQAMLGFESVGAWQGFGVAFGGIVLSVLSATCLLAVLR